MCLKKPTTQQQGICLFSLKAKFNILHAFNKAFFLPSEPFQSLVRNSREGSALLISGRGLLASSKQSVILRKSSCFHFSLLQGLGAKGFPGANPVMPPRDSKPRTAIAEPGYPTSSGNRYKLCSSFSFCRVFRLDVFFYETLIYQG